MSASPNPIKRGAGGTPGGQLEFFAGAALIVVGVFLLASQVIVTTSFWHIGGYNAFGITLIPLLLGIVLLFFNGKSRFGWVLVAAGAIIIVLGILANLDIYLRLNLINTIIVLALIAAGIGLIARSLLPHP